LQPHEPEVQNYRFEDDGRIPNNPELPLPKLNPFSASGAANSPETPTGTNP
jgi:uncharacterized protein YjlB